MSKDYIYWSRAVVPKLSYMTLFYFNSRTVTLNLTNVDNNVGLAGPTVENIEKKYKNHIS